MSCKITAPPHWSSSRTPLGSTKWPNHHKYTKITPPKILYLPFIDNVTTVTAVTIIFDSPFSSLIVIFDRNCLFYRKKVYFWCKTSNLHIEIGNFELNCHLKTDIQIILESFSPKMSMLKSKLRFKADFTIKIAFFEKKVNSFIKNCLLMDSKGISCLVK